MTTTRRSLLGATAWTIPVIAVAVAAPQAAASQPAPTDPPVVVCGGPTGAFPDQDNGTYTVDHENNRITVVFKTRPDSLDLNVRTADGWTKNYHPNLNSLGADLVWIVQVPPGHGRITWVQVHGFNSHYGETC